LQSLRIYIVRSALVTQHNRGVMTISNTPICAIVNPKSLISGDSMTSQANIRLRKLRQVEPKSAGGKIARRILEDEFGYNFDPIIKLIELAQRTNNDAVAAQCYAQVCKYCYPQLKSVEMKSTTLHEVAMPDMELANRFRQYIEKTCINDANPYTKTK